MAAYHVVQFLNELNVYGQKVMDLVPSSWTTFENGSYYTSFPPEKDHSRVPSWTALSKEPNPAWHKYPVKLIISAENHQEGMRRLERAYDELSEVDNSDADLGKNSSERSTTLMSMSRTEASNILDMLEETDASKNQETIASISECSIQSDDEIACKRRRLSKPLSESSTSAEVSTDSISGIKSLLDEQFLKISAMVESAMSKCRRSITYDNNKNFDRLLNQLQLSSKMDIINEIEIFDGADFDVSIPITTVGEFELFDQQIKEDANKLNKVKKLIVTKVGAADNFKKAVGIAIKIFMAKEVQLQYSGKGKMVNGCAKKNFSETNLFEIIKGIICNIWTEKENEIIKYIGIWLAGAKDRDGGKKERTNI
ncbi:hypothetical protein PV328_012000 [Microctonus aethiopoides]|uniref:DUF4806 domain-containing protein n=1 Tax=Microctonus aethiopoides TaxID=144406 RepID=A0AA39EWZ8_9HYME|nr:hypothetical protein PV328_012000 [Microctonus aethiopoides]